MGGVMVSGWVRRGCATKTQSATRRKMSAAKTTAPPMLNLLFKPVPATATTNASSLGISPFETRKAAEQLLKMSRIGYDRMPIIGHGRQGAV